MPDSLTRQLAYFAQRHLLRRRYMVADGLPFDMRFRFRTPDDVGRRIYKRRVHEPHVLALLRDQVRLQRPALVLDAGANLGWYTVLMHRLHGRMARIYAFEPDALNRQLLGVNLQLNGVGDVHVADCALSDRDGQARLYRYRDINLGRHSLGGGEPTAPGRQAETVTVECRRLDGYLASQGVAEEAIELFKIDVEGHEPELIRGAERALAQTRLLILEFSPMYYEPADAREMLERITAAGLEPRVYDSGAWRKTDPDALLALEVQRDTAWQRPG